MIRNEGSSIIRIFNRKNTPKYCLEEMFWEIKEFLIWQRLGYTIQMQSNASCPIVTGVSVIRRKITDRKALGYHRSELCDRQEVIVTMHFVHASKNPGNMLFFWVTVNWCFYLLTLFLWSYHNDFHPNVKN